MEHRACVAPGRIQLGDGDIVRLQAAKVSASSVGARRGDCAEDVTNRGGTVSVQDQVERGAGAQSHQIARTVHRLAASRQRPQERQVGKSNARQLLGELCQNQVIRKHAHTHNTQKDRERGRDRGGREVSLG